MDLGLSEQEFWDLTPAQFDALCERIEQEQKANDYRAGLIACILSNIYRKEGSPPAKPGDFFPSLSDTGKAKKEMTGAESLAYMRLVSAAFGTRGKQDGKRG